jgi:hypothetical protein
MGELLIVLIVAALVVAAIVYAVRAAGGTGSARRPAEAPWSDLEASGSRIVLDLVASDPDDESVQRLVQGAATQALAHDRELTHVEVVDREGTVLGTVHRTPKPTREVDLPPELHEPHARRSRSPDVTRPSSGRPRRELTRDERAESIADRPWAERFELPDRVLSQLDDRDHPAELIRAILHAAGRPAERHGELVLTEDVAFVTVSMSTGADEALTRAFLRVQNSGMPHGIVVRLGYADPRLVQRRDLAAPNVRYTDAEAIQRMADALALGADPVAFAVGPRVLRAVKHPKLNSGR